MVKRKRTGITRWLMPVCLIGVFGIMSWWIWASNPYSDSGPAVKITVLQGETIGGLAENLKEQHLIRSTIMFKYLVYRHPGEVKLYLGDYSLAPTMSPGEILNSLIRGPVSNTVTIPEGYTTSQIIDLLVRKGIGTKDEYIKLVKEGDFSYSFLENAPQGIHRLEGFLFPNTYDISPEMTPYQVVDMLLRQFKKELTPSVEQQLRSKNLTVAQWVTLASLIEKEAVKAEDRPLIASVLMNRLKIKQPLQIDATIQFLLDEPKEKLTYKDLEIQSPYNTYLHVGYPPGPIANPGHASLEAVLNPAKTNYRYYVAKTDGYHVFAETYEEHLKNVDLYQ